jgi:ABC-type multidrug transport system ATPase subunit
VSADDLLVHLDDFTVRHRRGPSAAVSGVSLRLQAGERVLVSGGPASGKTSLLRGVLGLVPSSGTATVLGGPPGAPAARHATGFGPEGRPFIPGLRLVEMVRLIARLRGASDAAIADALSLCGLDGHSRDNPLATDVEIARRASLAMAAAGEPRLLLLDDPWESPETLAVLDAARARGAGAIIATADPGGFPGLVDRHVVLVDGQPE